jgi:hypothetical protein
MLRSDRLDTVSRTTASATCTTTSAPRPRDEAVDPRVPLAASTRRTSERDNNRTGASENTRGQISAMTATNVISWRSIVNC